MKSVLETLTNGGDLDPVQMEATVGDIMDGRVTDAQIGAFLTALRMKGETVDELIAAVKALRARGLRVHADGPLLDIVGTGGDGLNTFNISTAAAFVAAAGGARVAKHGNRAATGKAGAADVLEAVGARIELAPDEAVRVLDRTGFTFLFAPRYHPAVKNVVRPRRELGFRTIFNLTGPLSNPAAASRQVIGLFAPEWLEPVAAASLELGAEHVFVVHGSDGSDEITTTGPTRVIEVRDGKIERFEIEPSDFGISVSSLGDLEGGDAARNAEILRNVLGGQMGAAADSVALNAGAGLFVAGQADSLADGVAAARQILAGAKALRVLENYVAASQEPAA
jgi:anthranilate phosphoribosyltransferase